jgi:hypothetical protein
MSAGERNSMGKGSQILIVIVALILTGCAGIHYTDSIQAVDITRSGRRTVTSTVSAQAEDWRNSGVLVSKGRTYRISASGKWKFYLTAGWTGPDGIGAYNLICWDNPNKIIQGYSHSTLIGKIGEDGDPFVIGNELELVAQTDGILFFRINE